MVKVPEPHIQLQPKPMLGKLTNSRTRLYRVAKKPKHTQKQNCIESSTKFRRVWKACVRCRVKKTKCDGDFPCQKCKDDGLICTVGTRKMAESKQYPKGYTEILENTQHSLIATIQKLYVMVRQGQSWELGEPELNGRGQPTTHDIASRIGCLRPSSDMSYSFLDDTENLTDVQYSSHDTLSEENRSLHDSDRLSPDSLAGDHTDRARSESNHSIDQGLSSQSQIFTTKPKFEPFPPYEMQPFDGGPSCSPWLSPSSEFLTTAVCKSPEIESPTFCNYEAVPCSEDLLQFSTASPDYSILYTAEQQLQGMLRSTAINSSLGYISQIVRPSALTHGFGTSIGEQQDCMMFGDSY